MDVARLIVRGWWVVIIVMAVTVAAASYTSLQQQPVYRASSMLLVAPSPMVVDSREATINSINVLDRRTIPNTFAEIARSRSTLEKAAETAGYSPADLGSVRTSAVVLPETFVVRIMVDAEEPEKAAAIANGILDETGVYGLSAYPAYQARALEWAIPATTAVSPEPVRDIGMAALVGGALGLLVAFAVQFAWSAYRRRASAGASFGASFGGPRSGPISSIKAR